MDVEQKKENRISVFFKKRIPYVAMSLSFFIPTLIRFILGETGVDSLIGNLLWTVPVLFLSEKWLEKHKFVTNVYLFLLLIFGVKLF